MKAVIRTGLAAALVLLYIGAGLAQLDKISNQDANAGLKAALEKGSVARVFGALK